MRKVLLLTAVVVCLLCNVARADALYPTGFTWDPRLDRTVRPDSDAGTTNGNPEKDSNGNPVWSYEYIVGVPGGSLLGSANPWYTRPTGKMVWDVSWYGQSPGVWVYADNVLPNAMGYGQTNTRTGASVTRWISPCQDAVLVNMVFNEGTSHTRFFSSSGAIDFAVCLDHNTGPGDIELLYGMTFNPSNLTPTGDGTGYWLPRVDLGNILVNPGESIFLTTINRGTDSYGGIATYGHITVVPEPSSILVLAGGLAALLGLRRRR